MMLHTIRFYQCGCQHQRLRFRPSAYAPGWSAYAPQSRCICNPEWVHMHPTPSAYAPHIQCICTPHPVHMHRRLFWEYFFSVNFEQAPMKLTRTNAYDRGKIVSVPLDTYRSRNKKFWFFLIRFWPVLSALCSKIPPKSSKFSSKPCKP